MLPNEYHKLVAGQILGCDIERLDAAIREETGHGLLTLIRNSLPRKGNNLKFRNFNLIRFARKDFAEYIGKIPTHDGCPTQIYKIECERTDDGHGRALVLRNGNYLFNVHAKSYHKIHQLAISALHSYIGDCRRRNRSSKAANKQKKAEVK
jgi:hypothetical protein